MFKSVAVIALMVITFWGCQDEVNKTGFDLMPGDRIYARKDSIYFAKSYTISDDKLRTNKTQYNILGTLNDPVFGKTSADFACQFRLVKANDFTGAILDSLNLTLRYYEWYGDKVTPQLLKVYELNSDLDAEGVYLQDVDLKSLAKGEVLAQKSYAPKLKLDSLSNRYGSTKEDPKDTTIQNIVFHMNPSLAQKLMAFQAPPVDPSKDNNVNDIFLQYFKGLYVEAGDLSQGGNLMRINTLDADSEMKLYYHKPNDTVKYVARYSINSSSARVNRLVHDYSTTHFVTNLNKLDQQDSLIYLQTTGGLSSKLYIPDLNKYNHPDSAKLVINKAELVLQVEKTMADTFMYAVPHKVVLSLIEKKDINGPEILVDSLGQLISPSDLGFSEAYYGGYYNELDQTYRFNLAKHLQEVIKGKTNHGFYLTTVGKNSSFRRVVLKGATSKTGIRFEVTSSKIE